MTDDWPTTRVGFNHRVEINDRDSGGVFDLYIITGCYPDGRLGEVFLRVAKEGSTLRGLLNGTGILISQLLREGCSVHTVAELLRESGRFSPIGPTDNPTIPESESLLWYVGEWLERTYGQ